MRIKTDSNSFAHSWSMVSVFAARIKILSKELEKCEAYSDQFLASLTLGDCSWSFSSRRLPLLILDINQIQVANNIGPLSVRTEIIYDMSILI